MANRGIKGLKKARKMFIKNKQSTVKRLNHPVKSQVVAVETNPI